MRFYAVNATGITVHVRLDREADDVIVLTVSRSKLENKVRPISSYVLARTNPTHIAYMDDRKSFTLRNPDRMIIEDYLDGDKDRILKLTGFLH